MKVVKLLFKNAFRHKLRTILTIFGIAIAVMAFAMMRFVVTAWNAGIDVASADRVIVRHAVSFVFQLPIAYKDKILNVPGVKDVTNCTWFQGIYKDPADFNNFFARIAINPDNFFKIYPEYIVSTQELEAFRRERNACIIGEKTAALHKLKIGDVIPIEGDIYPGKWQFVVRGIYKGKDSSIDATQMFFDWRYLDEAMRRDMPQLAGVVGWYVMQVDNPSQIASISTAVDNLFKNSTAETKTETEKAFYQSFISMSSALIKAMNVVSFVIIGIILLVLANTMAMTARERITEYAVMKTLGFGGKHLVGLIAGEAMLISVIGGLIGVPAAVVFAMAFTKMFPTWFPNFPNMGWIIIAAFAVAVVVGVASALFPALRATRMRIVDGLRYVG